MKRLLIVLLFILQINNAISQSNDWPAIPGLGTESPIVLIDESSFYGVMGAAIISYGLSQFVFTRDENLNFYQIKTGIVGTTGGIVTVENFGVDNRVKPWFGIGLEINSQQWFYPQVNEKGMGIGFITNYRWYLLGKKRISPYLEYGAGVFYGFKKFPPDAHKFSFHLTSNLGLEYTLENIEMVELNNNAKN